MITVLVGGLVAFLLFLKSDYRQKTNQLQKLAIALGYVVLGLVLGLSVSINLGTFFLSTQIHVSKSPNCWVIDHTPSQDYEKGKPGFVLNDVKAADKNLSSYDFPMTQLDFYFQRHGSKTYLFSYYHIDSRLFWIGLPINSFAYPYYHEVPFDPKNISFIKESCTQ